MVGWSEIRQEECDMNATTVAVDLAKSVFQLAVADSSWKVIEQHRLTRTQFERWFANRTVRLVIMEACGSAHHSARWLKRQGIEVKLLPAAYIRAYVRRNKTDAADACALIEAARVADIVPILVRGSLMLVEEIRLLEARIAQLERDLSTLAKPSPACTGQTEPTIDAAYTTACGLRWSSLSIRSLRFEGSPYIQG